jgi:hypothetical protein
MARQKGSRTGHCQGMQSSRTRADRAPLRGGSVDHTMSFTVGRVNFPGLTVPPMASCTMSPASIAYDGAVTNALWGIDSAQVPSFVNIDSGSGTADLQVVANLAVRGSNGMILRANYILFSIPS